MLALKFVNLQDGRHYLVALLVYCPLESKEWWDDSAEAGPKQRPQTTPQIPRPSLQVLSWNAEKLSSLGLSWCFWCHELYMNFSSWHVKWWAWAHSIGPRDTCSSVPMTGFRRWCWKRTRMVRVAGFSSARKMWMLSTGAIQALWQAAQVLLRHLFWQTRHLSKIELAVVPPLLMVKMHQLIQSRSIASLKTELFHFLSWSPTMSHLFAIHCAFCNRNFTYFNDLLHVWLFKHCFAWSHSP